MEKLDKLLRAICKQSAELVNASASSIFLKEDSELTLVAACGYSEKINNLIDDQAKYRLGEGITGWIGEGNSFLANSYEEIKNHPNWKGKFDNEQWGEGPITCRGMIGIPIYSEEVIIGVIKVENKKEGNFTAADQKNLKIFSETAALAIETKKELINRIKGLNVLLLMPFDDKFGNVYFAIEKTISAMGMECKRLDKKYFVGDVLQEIHRSIENANFIIADITGSNPNVTYEVGYANALKKKVILFTQNSETMPFNLKNQNHFNYKENDLGKLSDELSHILKTMISGE